jgi:hypothetical protein
MRKFAGTVSALALLAAIGIWSQITLATKAVGVANEAAALRGGEQTIAAFALRFPEATEAFRPFALIGSSDAAVPWIDNLQHGSLAVCGNWVSVACVLSAAHKPAAEAQRVTEPATVTPPAPVREARAIAVAPPAGVSRPEPVRTPVAAAPPPASCKQNLPAAAARLERALAQIKAMDRRGAADQCAAYRRDFFEVVRAREVTAQCKTGAERAHDLGRIDAAVEDINGAIAASCGA